MVRIRPSGGSFIPRSAGTVPSIADLMETDDTGPNPVPGSKPAGALIDIDDGRLRTDRGTQPHLQQHVLSQDMCHMIK
ncbi:hypothetical protein GCM10027575_70320 [Phytohabitans suffuscus]